jgi:hypothetical protein
MTTPHPDAAALAAEAKRLMLAFAEQVWQAGTEGFNCATVAPCRAARAQAEAAIDRLAALAQRPESTSERTYCRFCGCTNPVGCKWCRPVSFSAQGAEVDLRGIDAGTLDDWNNLRSHGKVLANDQLVLVADLPTIIARAHHAGQVEEAVRRDAERYRWLLDNARNSSDGDDGVCLVVPIYSDDWDEKCDEAIDKAMQADSARAQLGGGGS